MKELKAKLKILLVSGICLMAILTAVLIGQNSGKSHFVIGAKNCTEQHILGEILAILIETKTDLKAIRRFNLEGTTICFNALNAGAIDTYFEYTGTALLDILKEPLIKEPLYPYVKNKFKEKFGILWLDRLGFCNQYVLISRADSGLENISQVYSHPTLQIAFDPEFTARLELKLLKQAYGLNKDPKMMDQVLLYFSLLKKGVDVISGCSTDGRLLNKDLIVLKDDRECLPKYEIAPIVKIKSLEKYPEINEVFSLLKNKITEREMSYLNYQVEFQEKDIHQVAQEFIKNVILIK